MSTRALLLGVRQHLRQAIPANDFPNATAAYGVCRPGIINANNIDVRPPPGRPPAIAGEQYVAIWSPSVQNQNKEGLLEYYTVHVTISVRAPVKPDDRFSDLLTDWPRGLYSLAELTRASLHLNYDVTSLANTYINTAVTSLTGGATQTANGFVEPLYFQTASAVETKAGNWFKASSRETSAALVMTLTFDGGLRAQRPEQMS